MLKKLVMFMMLALFSTGFLAACYQTGKATGKAADKVEEGADDFKKGYKEGKDK